MKRASLVDAMKTHDRTAAAPARPKAVRKKISQRQSGRKDKKSVIAYFRPEAVLQLKQIGINRGGVTQQKLLQEALNDFFLKHRKPAIA